MLSCLLGEVFSQNETLCIRKICSAKVYGGGLTEGQVYEDMREASLKPMTEENFSRPRREVNAEASKASNQVIETQRVIVQPALGQPPFNAPPIGTPGGGAAPSEDKYIANFAPQDSVPIAIYRPIDFMGEEKKCVLFSELTDFELLKKVMDEEIELGRILATPTVTFTEFDFKFETETSTFFLWTT